MISFSRTVRWKKMENLILTTNRKVDNYKAIVLMP